MRFGLCYKFFENFQSVIERCIKTFFFPFDHFLNVILVCFDFRKNVAHGLNKGRYELINKRLVHTYVTSETGGAAQDPAENISASFVAGKRTITNGKCQCAHVIGNDAHRCIKFEL